MKRGERGLTLLEMIVAALIMGIAVVGLLSGITTSMRNAARITDHDRAVLLAHSKMDELLADLRLPRDLVVEGRFDRASAGSIEAGWRARATMFAMSPRPAAGQGAMERGELEVWWNSGRDRRTFMLEGFRTRILLPEDIPPTPQPQ